MSVATRLPVLMMLLVGLSGCLSTSGLTDKNGTIRDTAEQYVSWTVSVEDNVAREVAGTPPEKFSNKSWPVWWAQRVGALRDVQPNGHPTTENAEWYVAYIQQARTKAGLTPLPPELGPRPCVDRTAPRCWETTAMPDRPSAQIGDR